jgi:hypothetical protein
MKHAPTCIVQDVHLRCHAAQVSSLCDVAVAQHTRNICRCAQAGTHAWMLLPEVRHCLPAAAGAHHWLKCFIICKQVGSGSSSSGMYAL